MRGCFFIDKSTIVVYNIASDNLKIYTSCRSFEEEVERLIELKQAGKSYDGVKKVVDNLNLIINDGEIVVLIGESGCGKTTTMKMINRLIEPTSGTIEIDGKDIKQFEKIELRRNIGYVIQQIGLFPHLTIAQNIALIPKMVKKDAKAILAKVKELMDMIDLSYEDYADRYPGELSGGQQQRIGVARALANDPDIILMDEPFSALDPITREQLQDELLKLQDELHKTIIFVTHDIDEAFKIGDKVALMKDGAIIQYDTPEGILKNPVNDFVENFIGKDRLWKTPDMLKASDVMDKKVVTIGSKRSIASAIEIMRESGAQVLVVTEKTAEVKTKILGLVGQNRLRGTQSADLTMKDIMKTDFKSTQMDTCLATVLTMRKENNLSYTPVLDDHKSLVGIITNASILNVITDVMPESEDY